MEDSAGPGLLYARAEQLKGDKKWRHELRKIYKLLLVDHLAYASDKKVEADLWGSFKAEVTELQKAAKKSTGGARWVTFEFGAKMFNFRSNKRFFVV